MAALELLAESVVDAQLVRDDPGLLVDVFCQCILDLVRRDAVHHPETPVSVSLCHRDHRRLFGAASALVLPFVARLTTEVGLVNLDGARELARGRRVAETVTEAAQDEQRRLVGDLRLAGELESADALLRRACTPERVHPDAQRQPAFLEHGAGPDREHLLAAPAAPAKVLLATAPVRGHLVDVEIAAAGARGIDSPAMLFEERDPGGFVVSGLPEGFEDRGLRLRHGGPA
ncbi:MAG TPA: hypothetical protein VNB06_20995 [Thermoanaerobaculia bacterium]|nr:hypothetical protein [Thermoanaerobaculia bacterium]